MYFQPRPPNHRIYVDNGLVVCILVYSLIPLPDVVDNPYPEEIPNVSGGIYFQLELKKFQISFHSKDLEKKKKKRDSGAFKYYHHQERRAQFFT